MATRPTGELPKRNSKLAKIISGTKSNKLNPAQARAAAGKYRDAIKASGAKSLDATGAALGKAIKDVKKPAAKNVTVKAAAKKAAAKKAAAKKPAKKTTK
jgi:hypothetical protein